MINRSFTRVSSLLASVFLVLAFLPWSPAAEAQTSTTATVTGSVLDGYGNRDHGQNNE